VNRSQIELEKRIKRIDKVFGVNSIISRKISPASIASYYNRNKLAYWLFHSRKGFVHMGISRNMKYHQNDLLEQPKTVAKYIKKLRTHKVLELATGKGASSIYLAKLFPKVQFYGIDLPQGQIDIAKKAAKKASNFFPEECDYHDLSRYSNGQFGIVFAIESLCHSVRKEKVFKEVRRVLQSRGIFIVIDGYLGRAEEQLTGNEQLAKKLMERGMMVEHFEYHKNVKEKIGQNRFKIVEEEDTTRFIIPTIKRFESLASKTLFNYPNLGRLIVKLLPREFTANAISAYLMPVLIKLGIAKYTILVVQK
jgi:ubiquinone/menaquinone biosynthesis C-methylase UbiE